LPDEDTPWYLQLLVSLVVLVGVAALIGGILAVGGFTAARMLGVTGPQPSSSPESVYIPTPSSAPHTSPTTGPKSTPPSSPTPSHRPHSSPRSPSAPRAITLAVSPAQVSVYGRIDLRGTYAAPDGTTLQVQRQEADGAWLDFPTTASVSGGTFSTYIETGHTGVNRLRMTDPSTGQVSNVETVQVG